MDATVRFYPGVLDMRVVATVMAGPMRHYFFEIRDRTTIATRRRLSSCAHRPASKMCTAPGLEAR